MCYSGGRILAGRGGQALRIALLLAGYRQISVKRAECFHPALFLRCFFLQTDHFLWRARQDSNLRPSLFVVILLHGQGGTVGDRGRQNSAFIRSLRATLEGKSGYEYIHTVRGVTYRFEVG